MANKTGHVNGQLKRAFLVLFDNNNKRWRGKP